MDRRISFTTWVDSAGVIDPMLRRIKPAFREVDPSYKSNGIIYHHNLLVVTGAHGMMPVETELKSSVGSPVQLKDGKYLPIQSKDHGKIPVQNMRMEATMLRNDRIEKGAKLQGKMIRQSIPQQPYSAVDIPPDNKNGFLGLCDSPSKCREIGCTVDQEGSTPGRNNAPAILSFDENLCAALFFLLPGSFG
jgi:hypothetical protein